VLSSFDEGVIREVREAMDTQARQGGEEPRVYVGPERDHFGVEYADAFTEAVESGGGTIVADPEEAEAIVWIGSNKTKLQAGRWALGLLKDLYERAAPEETPEWHYDEVAACFREARAAMSTDWPGGFYTYEEEGSAVADRFDVALYPEGKAGLFIYAGCHTFAIPNTARDRPGALALLRFLTSRESQAYEARLGTLPAREDSSEDARAAAPDASLAARRWSLLEEAKAAALIPSKHPNYPAVEDAIWQGIREAILGYKGTEEALRQTEAAAGRAAEGSR
jgi:multiple sugar transport system substrate-binding protein